MKTFIAFLVTVLTLAFASVALAYTPPPMTAHVTDTAHKLSEPDRLALDKKLEDYRVKTTNEIAVFIPATLDGESIDDVANATGRAWKIGVKGVGNGVLLVIAPVERKVRIETNRGVEGELTDLQSNDIIQHQIKPHLTPGREDYRAAVDDSTTAIMAALDKGGVGGTTHKSASKPASSGDLVFGIVFLLFMLAVPIIFMILIVRFIARAFSSNNRSGGTGWASGGTWSNDSSWSSSSNDSSWSSGGGGGGSDWGGSSGGGGDSGFSGGGSDTFSGGGSSDSF